MAYNTSKGPRNFGDLINEDDVDTHIDWDPDKISFRTNSVLRMVVDNSGISGSGVLQNVGNAYIGGTLNVTGGVAFPGLSSGSVAGPGSYLGVNASGLLVLDESAGGGGTPAGSSTQVQYNDAGSFGASAGMTYNKTTNTLFLTNVSASSTLHVVGATSFGAAVAATGSITAGTSFIIGAADINETDLEKLDGITNGTVTANKAFVADGNLDISGYRNISGSGILQAVGNAYIGGTLSVTGNADFNGTVTCDTSLTIDSTTISAAEIGFLDGVTGGTAAANKAVTCDGNADFSGYRNISGSGTVQAGGPLSVTATISGSGHLTIADGSNLVMGQTTIQESDIAKIDGITNGTVAANKAVVADGSLDISGYRNLSGSGTVSVGSTLSVTSTISSSGHVTIADGSNFKMGQTTIQESDIAKVDGVTNGTVAANKAVVADGSLDFSGYRNISGSGIVQSAGNAYFGAALNVTGAVTLSGPSSGSVAGPGSYLGVNASGLLVLDEPAGGGGISWDGSTANGVATYKDSDEATVESNLTFDGTDLGVSDKIVHIGDTDTFINFTDDDINFQAGGVNFLDLTEDTQNEVTFNEGGVDVDFRVETADESHMLFIEGSSNRMSIGDNTGSPGATLEIKNHASAGATGVPLLQLNNNDTDQQCLDINADNITANVVNISAHDVTSAKVISIGADGLTTGNAFKIDDDSPSTSTRSTSLIVQNHTGAIAATALTVQSDGGVTGVKLDKNYSDLTEASITGLHIDWDKTGASTSDNTMYGIQLDMDNTTATNGNNYMYGLYVTPTLTHAADAGGAFVYGAFINAQGGTNGSSLVQGARIEAGGGDVNYGLQLDVEDGGVDLRIESSADSGDYFQIQTTTHGATTITTVDDNATAADLTFTIDGDITLDPAGGDVNIDGNLSASINISASAFYGNGSNLTNLPTSGISWDGSTANGIATYKDADEATVESNLTFDGSTLKVIGAVSGSTTLETVGNAYVGGNMAVSGTIEFAGTTKLVNDAGSGEVAKFGTGTLTTGKLYFLHTGSVWLPCDAGVAESGSNALLGIALGSNPLVHGVLTRGYFDMHTYLSGTYIPGRAIYMGSDGAAGYISTYQPSGSGDVVRIVGHAATGTNIVYFNPSPDWIEL
jgi:hypothetical protein